MEKSGEASFFSKVCVDIISGVGKRTHLVKKYDITEVPTILVNNNKYVGKTAFNWLKNQIEKREHNIESLDTRNNKIGKDTKAINNLNNTVANNTPSYFEGFSSDNSLFGNSSHSYQIIGQDDSLQQMNNPQYNNMLSEKLGNNKLSQQESSDFLKSQSESVDTQSFTPEYQAPVSEQRELPDELKTISISKDKLKSKQIENRYHQLINERDST